MAEEKRNFERIATKVIVHCMKNTDQEYVPHRFLSFTKDLSCQGARIIALKDIKPGDQFTVTLEIPTLFIPVLTFSEAVWVRNADTPKVNIRINALEVGIKFLKIEPSDSEKLKSFLEFKEEQVHQSNLNAKSR